MELNQVKALIEKGLPYAQVMVVDLVGDGDHLEATVISDLFEGKGLLEQHQMVYAALGDCLKQTLHALKLKTYTKQQWQKSGR